jgi:hypothetical protein
VFINNAEPSLTTFKDVTADSSFNDKNAMGLAVGDIDNDGKQDFFMTGIWGIGETIGNKLIKNNGGGKFTDISFSAGIFDGSWGWGACMADFNLDGYLDIFNVNGWSNDGWNNYDSDLSRLFINLKNGTFKESSAKAGMYDATQGRGIVCADFDNDGDVDILVTHRGYVNAVTLWRNDMTGQNSLKVKLIGHGLNSEAVGARITIEMGGQKQMREIMINSNFISQNPTLQVFGLGKADHVDMIIVEWPDGKVEHHTNVLAGSVSYSWE